MTKYILNSGGLKNCPEKADKFNEEVVKGLSKTPNILFCHFAVTREQWGERFIGYIERFLESMDADIQPRFELALPHKFID